MSRFRAKYEKKKKTNIMTIQWLLKGIISNVNMPWETSKSNRENRTKTHEFQNCVQLDFRPDFSSTRCRAVRG